MHSIIIDEVHVFIQEYRGEQLAYLHHRLKMQTTASLQTLALSATLGDAEDIKSLFSLGESTFHFHEPMKRTLQPCWVHIEDEESELSPFFDDLHHHWGCQKILVFANSRKKCEQLYELLGQEGVFSKKTYLHYSNLSTQERKLVERSFREKSMGVCIATSTLELGIDIGDVNGIVLIGPPSSTMAFLQRIGRGNRRKQHIKFWGVCQGGKAGLQLIRFLALFELAKEYQVEAYPSSEKPSVLFQQFFPVLKSHYTLHLLGENCSIFAFFSARNNNAILPRIILDSLSV